jgi:hypothetical protein
VVDDPARLLRLQTFFAVSPYLTLLLLFNFLGFFLSSQTQIVEVFFLSKIGAANF